MSNIIYAGYAFLFFALVATVLGLYRRAWREAGWAANAGIWCALFIYVARGG